ncbi:MAG TPA: transglycosylase domain-containing protein, partial [Oligoflexia bacterium]|nr:transglycosylase domain-containing protein [Oligoflexia bacterium]
LMTQERQSRPSIIYSDIFVIRKDAIFENQFLLDRLADLRIPFRFENGKLEYAARSFEYPETLRDPGVHFPVANALIAVETSQGLISAISVDGESHDAIALEPTTIAQLSGNSLSIRDYVKIGEIPTQLLQAIIAIEDQRFLDHPGFDLRSLMRAMWVNLQSGSFSQGGSTITQQLIKNLLGTRQKTVARKARELVLAILMEARYTKEQILEKYLNEVYFGQIGSLEVHGVAEAARYFFAKSIDKLSLAEMALICGVIRGPGLYSPYKNMQKAIERKDTVLGKMMELRIISGEDYELARGEQLTFAPPTQAGNRAPYFVDYVKAQVLDQLEDRFSADDLSAQGLRIYTTLDLQLQKKADAAVAAWVRELESRHKIERPLRLEGLLVVGDQKSASLRALVGGRSYAETNFNRVLNMKRQAGSTFKPIIYLAAFEKEKDASGVSYTPAYLIDDEPWTHKYVGDQQWSPRNYEKTYRGRIGLREAFVNSINIPAAKIGVDVGPAAIASLARKLGVQSAIPEVPSVSLGSVDVSPLDLLSVYTTFANQGAWKEMTAVTAITDASGGILARFVAKTGQAAEQANVDLLNHLLNAVTTEGTAKSLPALGYKKTSFGKTGTTSFYRDAWFAGFSEDLVAVAWAGFDELKVPDSEDTKSLETFKSPAQLTGAGSALPIWARFFATARPAALAAEQPLLETDLEKQSIDRSTGLISKSTCPNEWVYEEKFKPGTLPEKECDQH